MQFEKQGNDSDTSVAIHLLIAVDKVTALPYHGPIWSDIDRPVIIAPLGQNAIRILTGGSFRVDDSELQ